MSEQNQNNLPSDHTLIRVINEVSSNAVIRQDLMKKLTTLTGRKVISYISSMYPHPIAFINDWDAETIENILRSYGKVDKLDLIIHSSGGFAESAERIVNSIYSYCDDFRIIIPTQAKSAATMVAMGASSILMSDTSEIGAIDPQLPTGIAAQSVIKAYEELKQKIDEKQKQQQPYDTELISISKIDPILLRECRKYMGLAKDIALKLLNKKMLSDKPMSISDIETRFLDDGQTFSHGRLINHLEAEKLGLKIEYVDKFDEKWKIIWEIYIRSKVAVSQHNFSKIIEDEKYSLQAGNLPIRQG